MSKEPKLKPCPFCGSKAEILRYQGGEEGEDISFHGRCTNVICPGRWTFDAHWKAVLGLEQEAKMSKEPKLKLCPFCPKGRAILSYNLWYDRWEISCNHCFATIYRSRRASTIKAWNRRAK
jgi:hypothetical protein